MLVLDLRPILGGLPKRHQNIPLGNIVHVSHGIIFGSMSLLLRCLGFV